MRLLLLAGLALAGAVVAALAGPARPDTAPDAATTAARIALGRRLFYDADLSADGTMACATCHEQRHGFADGNKTHPGVTGQAGRRNVPGLANVGRFPRLTVADPTATSLERQALTPLLGTHPVEMGMLHKEPELARRLGAQACYRTMFTQAFPRDHGRIDLDTVTRALAAFEHTITAPPPRPPATPLERQGQALFRRACAQCHAGPDFSDFRYHRLEPADPAQDDQGLFETSGRTPDRGRFRTAPLRNVAMTGPWWHDGSAPTLGAAITRHGRPWPAGTMAALEAYLGTLNDTALPHRADLAMPMTACGAPL